MAWVATVSVCACGAPTPTDAGLADALDAPSDAVVACWTAVDAVIAHCQAATRPSPRRLCTLRAYHDACPGRPELVTAIANCLAPGDPCATARAPGTAASCVAGVVAQTDGAHTALDHAWCMCSPSEIGCPDLPALDGPELQMFRDEDATSSTACLTASCATPMFCFGSSPIGAALLQCNMLMP